MISKNILRRIFEGAGDAVGGVIFKTPPHTFLFLESLPDWCGIVYQPANNTQNRKT